VSKEQNNNNSWHLSKSVPVSLIVALVLQASAIVWTVSQMQSSIAANASSILKIETRTEKLELAVQGQAVALARIDENIKAIRMSVERIASKD
jgi:septal ring factor EnvC (AmiA/AmiB activator)